MFKHSLKVKMPSRVDYCLTNVITAHDTTITNSKLASITSYSAVLNNGLSEFSNKINRLIIGQPPASPTTMLDVDASCITHRHFKGHTDHYVFAGNI